MARLYNIMGYQAGLSVAKGGWIVDCSLDCFFVSKKQILYSRFRSVPVLADINHPLYLSIPNPSLKLSQKTLNTSFISKRG